MQNERRQGEHKSLRIPQVHSHNGKLCFAVGSEPSQKVQIAATEERVKKRWGSEVLIQLKGGED